jgi:hypothetical protein
VVLRTRTTSWLGVALAAAAISAVLLAGMITGVDPDSFEGRRPYVHLYDTDRNQLEAFLVTGDAQAFAALAQDPTLAHPERFDPPAEFSYRAQRPVWGHLAWVSSFGRPDLAGWALVVLSVLAAGALAAVTAALAARRGCSPWWGLLAVGAGLQTLSELTPELLAAALLGAALLCGRDRRTLAIALLCVAALTRESMLVGVAAWALWELVHTDGRARLRAQAVLPFAIPFVAYLGWTAFLHQRLGMWPWERTTDRLVAPLSGIADAWWSNGVGPIIGFVLGVALCTAAWALARRDVLTWIATAYLAFAVTFSADVWLRGGYQRTLVPLFVFGTVAVIGGVHARVRARDARPTVQRLRVEDARAG